METTVTTVPNFPSSYVMIFFLALNCFITFCGSLEVTSCEIPRLGLRDGLPTLPLLEHSLLEPEPPGRKSYHQK